MENLVRFDTDEPASGRVSFVASHARSPYVAWLGDGQLPGQAEVEVVANAYLQRLAREVGDTRFRRVVRDAEPGSDWLPIWPRIGLVSDTSPAPSRASWNLSIRVGQALPASIALSKPTLAADATSGDPGICVPMVVEETPEGFRITIRGMTAEAPLDPAPVSPDVTDPRGTAESKRPQFHT